MRAKRIDANQPHIVLKLRQLDMVVRVTSEVGNGFPDLVVLDKFDPLRRIYFIEVKDGDKPLSAQKLTPAEQDFAEVWPVEIIRSCADAVSWVARIRYQNKYPTLPTPGR